MSKITLHSVTFKPPSAALTVANVTQLFEPGPDWRNASELWGLYWRIHNFVYASFFVMISLHVVRSITIMACGGGASKLKMQLLLNTIMILLCSSRAFVLFADPYLQGKTFQEHKATRLLWYLGEAGLVSMHCLLIIILARGYTTKKVLNNVSFSVMITHYVVVIACVFAADKYLEKQVIVVFRQAYFLFWGLFIGVIIFRLARILSAKFKEIKIKRGRILISLIHTCGAFELVMMILYGYIAVTELVNYRYPYTTYMDAWKWLGRQSAMRLSEVISCELVMATLARHRTTYARMLRARRKDEMAMYGYYHSPNISVDDVFYSVSSTSSHNDEVKEARAGPRLADRGQIYGYMLSNQNQCYSNVDYGSYNFMLSSHNQRYRNEDYGYCSYAAPDKNQVYNDKNDSKAEESSQGNRPQGQEEENQECKTTEEIKNKSSEDAEPAVKESDENNQDLRPEENDENKGTDPELCPTEIRSEGAEPDAEQEVASAESGTDNNCEEENTDGTRQDQPTINNTIPEQIPLDSQLNL